MVIRQRPQPLRGRPTVSVVVPCYNYGRFLPDCVASVLGQNEVEVDVLIVDDASPDGSGAVARRLAEADRRVNLIAHDTNRGHIATYNEGLAVVEGEFVVLLSADDMLSPGSLARSVALLQANPEIGMVYGFSPSFTDQPPKARTSARSWTIWPGLEWVEQMCQRMSNPVSTPEVVMRGSLMREFVGYDPRLPHGADFLLWLRAATRGPIGRINGADQGFYRKHGANMHAEMFAGVYTDITERRRTFEILFDEDGPYFPPGHRLRDVALRSLAREALVTVCRAEKLGLAGDEPNDKLVALAAEMCPPQHDPELWRAYERIQARSTSGRGPIVPQAVGRAMEDVTGRVRWRRWRRTGLMSAVGSL